MNDRSLRVTASVGLAVGGTLGMAGTFASSASLRGLAWGIDGIALAPLAPIERVERLCLVGFYGRDSLVEQGFGLSGSAGFSGLRDRDGR